MQEDKDAKIIMDLIASASKAATSTPTSTKKVQNTFVIHTEAASMHSPKVQNTFVIHGGRQVFVQTTAPQRTSPKAKPPAKGRR